MTGNRVGVKIKYLQATTRVEKFAFFYIKGRGGICAIVRKFLERIWKVLLRKVLIQCVKIALVQDFEIYRQV